MHAVHIQSGRVRADGKWITVGFEYLGHAASLSHHGIIPEIHVLTERVSFPMNQSLILRGIMLGKENLHTLAHAQVPE